MKNQRPFRSGFFDPRVLLGFVLCSVGVLLALVGFGMSSDTAASPTARAKIAPEVLADTADGNNASVVILLADQADVSAAYGMKDQDARGWFVYNTLTHHAARTQAGLQAFLTAQGAIYQSFWAANMIVATAGRSLVDSLAARADVARIDSNKPARWIEDPEIANFGVTARSPNVPGAVEWGVMNVNAPSVWAMGFTGQGMVVGDLDTGMSWTHNALKPKYRGWNGTTADHNFNWHDAIHFGGGTCGPNTVAPCDDHGHGTHTAGTTVGDDGAGNQVGVAPGAKWIGCRNMNVGDGTPATYTECFQFMIAPTDLAGNNANPALRPHVLNNSWTCPSSEGCVTRAELETIVNNTEAAGIFVEASAGNSGPGCSSVSDPPALYSASFSTGAIDITNVLASFSSRGPSTFYTPNLLKPNISAPGVGVRSSLRNSDSAFGPMSGTSMAGPHVVGVVAVLWSARPQLVRDIEATKSILQNTANPGVILDTQQTCGGTPSTQIPNNSFGYGRVDALAAVNAVALPTPTPSPTATATATPPSLVSISGSVIYCSNPSLNPVPNVTLNLTGDMTTSTLSDGSGNYQFSSLVAGGNYTVTPVKAALAPGTPGINTVDVIAVQRHFLIVGTPLLGCRLTAADVNGDTAINTVDVIAIQRFFLSLSTGIANTGQYQFAPANHTYPGVASNQTAQDYDTLVFGDVASTFVH
jgi:serine protease AprX